MDKTGYWKELSDYDLETAEAMLNSKRFLYVGFMCHQCIEKIFKAFYAKVKEDSPPYTHSLSLLADNTGLSTQMTREQLDFLDLLGPLNIEARYPSYKERLLKSLSYTRCQEIIHQTHMLQSWIKSKL